MATAGPDTTPAPLTPANDTTRDVTDPAATEESKDTKPIKVDGEIVFGIAETRAAFGGSTFQMAMCLLQLMDVDATRRRGCDDPDRHAPHEWLPNGDMVKLREALEASNGLEVFNVLNSKTCVCAGKARSAEGARTWSSATNLMNGPSITTALESAVAVESVHGILCKISGRQREEGGVSVNVGNAERFEKALELLKNQKEVAPSVKMARLFRQLLTSTDGTHIGGHPIAWHLMLDMLDWSDLTGKEPTVVSGIEFRDLASES